jgi:hypothetical protein
MTGLDPQTISLADGRKIVIRCAREQDVASILDLFKHLFLDGEGMIGER